MVLIFQGSIGTSVADPRFSTVFSLAEPLKLSQVLPPQFYLTEGATFVVRETLRVNLSIVNFALVDVDFNYFTARPFLGRIGIRRQDFPRYERPNDVFNIPALETEVVRESTYSVASIDGDNSSIGTIVLDSCNTDGVITAIPFVGAVKQSFELKERNGVLVGELLSKPPRIPDSRFVPQIGGFEIFTYPGVRALNYRYEAEAVNIVSATLGQGSIPSCKQGDPCFQAIEVAISGPGNATAFRTLDEAIAYKALSEFQFPDVFAVIDNVTVPGVGGVSCTYFRVIEEEIIIG